LIALAMIGQCGLGGKTQASERAASMSAMGMLRHQLHDFELPTIWTKRAGHFGELVSAQFPVCRPRGTNPIYLSGSKGTIVTRGMIQRTCSQKLPSSTAPSSLMKHSPLD